MTPQRVLAVLAGAVIAVAPAAAVQDASDQPTPRTKTGGVRLPDRAPRIPEGVVRVPTRHKTVAPRFAPIGGSGQPHLLAPRLPPTFANPLARDRTTVGTQARDTVLPPLRSPRLTTSGGLDARQAAIVREIDARRGVGSRRRTPVQGAGGVSTPLSTGGGGQFLPGAVDGGWYSTPDLTLLAYYTPPVDEEPPPPQPSARERGFALLAEGRASLARDVLRIHAGQDPEDAEGAFALGLALALSGETPEGIASIADALWIDATLAERTDLVERFLPRTADRRRLTQAVVPYAGRAQTGDAFLVAAMSIRAMGNTERATETLRKAREAGLDPELSLRFAAAWDAPDR